MAIISKVYERKEMLMTVVDRRGVPLTTTFGDLAIGEAFTDDDGDINIKTDVGAAIYWTGEYWATSCHYSGDELIIPLEVTYTFERERSRE
jgi:hypothetical protein